MFAMAKGKKVSLSVLLTLQVYLFVTECWVIIKMFFIFQKAFGLIFGHLIFFVF